MAAAAAMQRETIALCAVLEAILLGRRLRRAARDEGRKRIHVAVIGLRLMARLVLARLRL
jgi:hypothetical protein